MMDRTDRHFRFLVRLISRRTWLYSEMVTTAAVLHGDSERLLGFDQRERPLALQLGGDDPDALARCARIGERLGFDDINLNIGCPSDRVQKGRFGACLMLRPALVAECVAAMRGAAAIPVTVKHRIGVDEVDRYEDLRAFVEPVAAAGCERFIVHARTAILSGLSPRENRQIPPLRYDLVYRLARDLPRLCIEINGGIASLDAAREHLEHVDGVMIGRAAYERPMLFAQADQRLFGGSDDAPTRPEIIEAMLRYIEGWEARGGSAKHVTRHMMGLFAGVAGARGWRRTLGECRGGASELRGLLEPFTLTA